MADAMAMAGIDDGGSGTDNMEATDESLSAGELKAMLRETLVLGAPKLGGLLAQTVYAIAQMSDEARREMVRGGGVERQGGEWE